MPTPLLWCRQCAKGMPLAVRVERCPLCDQPADWSDECPVPRVGWRLTRADWAFLRVQGIDPGQDEPEYT